MPNNKPSWCAGNEPSGRQVLLQWAEWMCSDYEKDPEVARLVDDFHVMLLPSMNPDGFDAQKRENNDGQVGACHGARSPSLSSPSWGHLCRICKSHLDTLPLSPTQDLNRNFPDPIEKMNFRGWDSHLPPTGKVFPPSPLPGAVCFVPVGPSWQAQARGCSTATCVCVSLAPGLHGVQERAETLALMSWTTAHRFVASVSMHEGALVANYPWDGTLV